MKKYDQYKNSGVEWLGEIPEHWDLLPGLCFIYENKEKNKGMKRNTVLSLSYGNIRIKGEDELTGLVPESFETYQFVNQGDLIFRPTDLQNDTVSLRSSISEYEGIITNAYLNLRFKSKANSKFYHYFFRSIDNNKIIYGLGSGLRQNISYLDFRRFPFTFPPKEEQTAIANFLDDKTTKIDQAIAIKQKQIELLKERRQILIHKAVTGGLNDKVKLKDSGVEWIGEIPEHWEVKRLKHVAEITYGISPHEKTYNDIEEGTILVNGPAEYSETDFGYTRAIKWTTAPSKFAKKGSLLFCLRGSTTGRLNICHSDLAVGRGCAAIFGKENHDFLIKAIIALKDRIIETFKGSTFPSVTSADLDNYSVPNPPPNEQIEIAEFIETATTKIATAISLKEQEIEKLKEYKMSLIDGVVTGKVKVC